MTCTTCGGELPAGSGACPTCGAAAPVGEGDADDASAPAGGSTAGPSPTGAETPPPGATPPGAAPPGAPPPGTTPAPHPSGLPSDVRNWALVAHLSAFAGSFVALAFLGPLVVWLLRREEDEFSTRHAREALNFNLTVFLVAVVGAVAVVPLAILTVGLILIPFAIAAAVIGLAWLLLTIIAAVKAAEGSDYRYPLTIRFVS